MNHEISKSAMPDFGGFWRMPECGFSVLPEKLWDA